MKSKFIKSTIILIIGGFLTKVLGMIIRIFTTRLIGAYGIGLYMLVMPTYSLFITISTLSLPVSISKLVSENTRNNKKLVFSILPVTLFINLFFVILFIFLSRFISTILLKNSLLYYPLIASSITLPFITLSSIIRGYFFGKQKMIPHVFSHLLEQIIRLCLVIFITPYFLKYGIICTITFLILFNIISELISIVVLIFFIPRDVKIYKSDIKPDIDNIKDLFRISFPTTIGRVIGSLGNFLEPIIITFVMLYLGYSKSYIVTEYGVLTGFVFPMVMLPQFLSGAISSALLPTISNYYALNKISLIKRRLFQAILYSFSIGLFFSILFFLFPSFFLSLMFNTSLGAKYLIISSPIFLITYIQGPIVSTLQAIDKASVVMKSNFICVIIKTISLCILLLFNIKMYALLLSIFISYLFITIYQYRKLKLYLSTY